ncbi:MAG: hypothetical protein KCHDKBKB_00082 [Elusimicrobia bacterium]|nr:hypothetical protein [Elusimicrobiota bacterium]
MLDKRVVASLAKRTFRQSVESPIAYVVAIFFYGFVGGLFGANYFINNQASIYGMVQLSPWLLWFVVPALTMGLLSEEFRLGTFEQLATLPVRDWEIVLGKFLGYAALAFLLMLGLGGYVILVILTASPVPGIDWGSTVGVLAGLYFLCLAYGAMGLFASSLTKNQVVSLIVGMIFCTLFFIAGQITALLPPVLGRVVDFIGVISHLESMGRGVWDIRDLAYFGSLVFFFLSLTVQRLSTRRF